MTERLKVVSGLRWEQIGLGYTPYPSLVAASQDYQPTTGRVGAVFEVTPSANVYASYSRAVEPTTQLVSLDGSQQRFSLVPGRQFEVGAKGGAFNGRLDGTFAYFAIEKRDLLITQLIDGIQTAQQIGKQTSHGIELAVVARPTRTLTIAADVALHRRRVRRFRRDRRRRQHRPVRQHAAQRAARSIWNISPTQRIGPFDLTATHPPGRQRAGATTPTPGWSSGFTTIDAAVGYRIRHGTRVMVRGRNLTDGIYTQSISNTAGRLEPPRVGRRHVHDRS